MCHWNDNNNSLRFGMLWMKRSRSLEVEGGVNILLNLLFKYLS